MLIKKIRVKNNQIFRRVKMKGPSLYSNDGITVCKKHNCSINDIAIRGNKICELCIFLDYKDIDHFSYIYYDALKKKN